MNQNAQNAVAEQPTATKENHWSEEPWSRVRTAIVQRWPHLDQRDIESVPCDVYEIENFLGEFTETPVDEIQAVVREHAPQQSVLQRASHLGEQVSDQLVPPVQSAVERVRYEADEHPGAVTGLIFVTGVALGVLATAAYFRTHQQASKLQGYLPSQWRR